MIIQASCQPKFYIKFIFKYFIFKLYLHHFILTCFERCIKFACRPYPFLVQSFLFSSTLYLKIYIQICLSKPKSPILLTHFHCLRFLHHPLKSSYNWSTCTHSNCASIFYFIIFLQSSATNMPPLCGLLLYLGTSYLFYFMFAFICQGESSEKSSFGLLTFFLSQRNIYFV